MPIDTVKIESALDDIHKNMATKGEVIKLIDEQVAKDREEQKAKILDIETNAKEAIEQLQKANQDLVKRIRNINKMGSSGSSQWPSHYKNSTWANPEQARNFGLFVLATANSSSKAREQLKEKGFDLDMITDAKAMGGGTESGGGALVPIDFIPTLISLQEKYGNFRANAQTWPMGSDVSVAPKLTSSLTVYCPGEGKAITASDLAVNTVNLIAKMWGALTAISIQLDEDSAVAIGEVVGRQIAWAFAKQEDLVGFLGDGTSTYFGCTGITGALRDVDATIANIKSLVVAAGNAYSEITLANFETLCGTLPDLADDGNAKWYAHRLFYFTVMVRLALAVGGANATEVSQGRGVREKSFLAYPIEFCPAMPKTEANSQICSIFGNLRMGAYLGERYQRSIDRSDEVYFANAQIGIRGLQRIAVTVHGAGDTTDAGAICGLITAAS